jgi:hypothetical protein
MEVILLSLLLVLRCSELNFFLPLFFDFFLSLPDEQPDAMEAKRDYSEASGVVLRG